VVKNAKRHNQEAIVWSFSLVEFDILLLLAVAAAFLLRVASVTHENTGQTRGSEGRKSPSGVQGQSPGKRSVPQKLNNLHYKVNFSVKICSFIINCKIYLSAPYTQLIKPEQRQYPSPPLM